MRNPSAVAVVTVCLALLSCESELKRQQRLEQEAWEAARSQNTEEAYESFLTNYPQGAHVVEGREALAFLVWTRTQLSNTQESYRDFARRFPESGFAEEASGRGRDFGVNVLDVRETGTVRSSGRATGPLVELVSLWGERTIRLNRDTAFAVGTDGGRSELECIVPVETEDYEARQPPYPDLGPDEEYHLTTVHPVGNTFTDRQLSVFCIPDKKSYFLLELGEIKESVRIGMIFESNYEAIKTVHLLGHTFETAAVAAE